MKYIFLRLPNNLLIFPVTVCDVIHDAVHADEYELVQCRIFLQSNPSSWCRSLTLFWRVGSYNSAHCQIMTHGLNHHSTGNLSYFNHKHYKRTGARRLSLLYRRHSYAELGHFPTLGLEKISVTLSYRLTPSICRYVLITLRLSHKQVKLSPLLNTIACFCFRLYILAKRSARELLAGTFLSCRNLNSDSFYSTSLRYRL